MLFFYLRRNAASWLGTGIAACFHSLERHYDDEILGCSGSRNELHPSEEVKRIHSSSFWCCIMSTDNGQRNHINVRQKTLIKIKLTSRYMGDDSSIRRVLLVWEHYWDWSRFIKMQIVIKRLFTTPYVKIKMMHIETVTSPTITIQLVLICR